MPVHYDFSGRRVIITGAAGGMGAAVTQAFLETGAHVFATDRAGPALDAIPDRPDHLKKVGCDLLDTSALRNLMQGALSWLGGCDALVFAAGFMPVCNPLEVTEELWASNLGVNLVAPYICIQETIEALKASDAGRIICFGSTSGKMGGHRLNMPYSAAKGGLHAMTFNLARELAKTGVTVNCVIPGPADTPMFATLPESMREKFVEGLPLRRLTKPEDLWPAVLFLASEEAGHITGELFDVNGAFFTD